MPEVELPTDVAARVARLLRHEVGDLLQGVYSTASILTTRLGAEQTLERQLMADLKLRAEQLKGEVDAVVRLVAPASSASAPLDLTGQALAAVTRLRRHRPQLPVAFESPGPAAVRADPAALPEALLLLLLAMGQEARSVGVRVEPGDPVRCRVGREGPAATEDQLGWLHRPFASTHGAVLGLALASCARAVAAAGGSVRASNDGQGFHVEMAFPPARGPELSGEESASSPGEG